MPQQRQMSKARVCPLQSSAGGTPTQEPSQTNNHPKPKQTLTWGGEAVEVCLEALQWDLQLCKSPEAPAHVRETSPLRRVRLSWGCVEQLSTALHVVLPPCKPVLRASNTQFRIQCGGIPS